MTSREEILNKISEIKQRITNDNDELSKLRVSLLTANEPMILKGDKKNIEVRNTSSKIDRKAMYMLTQRPKLAKYGMTLTDDLKLTIVDKL